MVRKHRTDYHEFTKSEFGSGEREALFKRVFSALDPEHKHSPDPAVVGVMWRLGATMHLMMIASDEFLKPYNLTSAKFRMLTWLFACEKSGYNDGLLPSELSHIQGVSPNTVSALMDGLQEQGLIQRIHHPTDHRKRIITITDAGRERLGDVGAAYKRFTEATMAKLSPDERETLIKLLDKLADSIKSTQKQMTHSPTQCPD